VRIVHDHYPDCPEAIIVALAGAGDRRAFAELVRRRQSQIRNLMRRCCNDDTLADDLSQQVFLKIWLNIHSLKSPGAFNVWLHRLAVNVWLQYLRKKDALRYANELVEFHLVQEELNDVDLDLDGALQTLPELVRLCVVLSYNEGLTHTEIATLTKMPLGTVKSHIRRGALRLQQLLSVYSEHAVVEES